MSLVSYIPQRCGGFDRWSIVASSTARCLLARLQKSNYWQVGLHQHCFQKLYLIFRLPKLILRSKFPVFAASLCNQGGMVVRYSFEKKFLT